ncbi:hypothetical protein C8Q79DRAFT_1005931 [Trametes meyenii]|nr:hypothetical protein C8Q79DRAFT_1005931 [Trametes meyenii]
MDDAKHCPLLPVNSLLTEHGPNLDVGEHGTDEQTDITCGEVCYNYLLDHHAKDESSDRSIGDVRATAASTSAQTIEVGPTNVANDGRIKVLCDDIIIDLVIQRLDLEDVARMLQVAPYNVPPSSLRWNLTGCPNLEKKARACKASPSPIPPTARYSFANLSAVESERLLLRCASLAREWDVDVPRYQHRWKIEAYHEVLEMTLLPGGQYMVAFVANQAWTRFAIEVLTADFKYAVGAPLAHLDVPTKAFELRAKFDVNAFPSDYQPYPGDRQLQYECVVAHVPLAASELLGHGTIPQHSREFREVAKKLARPFHILTEIISRSRLSNPVIDDDVDGVPVVAVLKHAEGVADRIVYKNLDGGPATTLMGTPHLNFPILPHAIMAFSISGDLENDVGEHTAHYYFPEFWEIIEDPCATLTRNPAARGNIFDCEGNYWEKVWMSDHGLGPSLTHDRSLRV